MLSDQEIDQTALRIARTTAPGSRERRDALREAGDYLSVARTIPAMDEMLDRFPDRFEDDAADAPCTRCGEVHEGHCDQ